MHQNLAVHFMVVQLLQKQFYVIGPRDEADKQDGLDAHRGADNQPIEKTGVVPEECLRNGLRQIKFQCDQCTQIFGEKLEFVRHVITAHKRRDKIVEKAEGKFNMSKL